MPVSPSERKTSAEDAVFSAFVSYASTADKQTAFEIAEHLEGLGLKCWIAPRNVRPGRQYASEIVRGIATSRCFILVLSQASNISKFVRREVEQADRRDKRVYTLRIEEVYPSDQLQLFLSETHWIDAWAGNLSTHVKLLAEMLRDEEGIAEPVSLPIVESTFNEPVKRLPDAAAEPTPLREKEDRPAKTERGPRAEPKLSPAEIAKAEELANWEYIKDSQSAQNFRDHLARFPKGVAQMWARGKLEAMVWADLGKSPSLEALEDFLAEFPDGKQASEAQARLVELGQARDSPHKFEDQELGHSAKKEAETVDKHHASAKKGRNHTYGRAALSFAVLALPLQLLLGWALSGGGSGVAFRQLTTGFVVASLTALSLATLLVLKQLSKLSAADLSAYWLGSALTLFPAAGWLFADSGWNWIGAKNNLLGGLVTGFLFAFTIILTSAMTLATYARQNLPRAGFAVYAFGCTLGVVLTLGSLFAVAQYNWVGASRDAGWYLWATWQTGNAPDLPTSIGMAGGLATGCLVAFGLAFVCAIVLAFWGRAMLTATEIGLYWSGCVLAAVVSIGAIFGARELHFQWLADLVGEPTIFGYGGTVRGSFATAALISCTLGLLSGAALIFWFKSRGAAALAPTVDLAD
jgi:hypothetical protein